MQKQWEAEPRGLVLLLPLTRLALPRSATFTFSGFIVSSAPSSGPLLFRSSLYVRLSSFKVQLSQTELQGLDGLDRKSSCDWKDLFVVNQASETSILTNSNWAGA